MTIPRWILNNYTAAINKVSSSAQDSVARTLTAIDLTDDVATVRQSVVEVMQGVCALATDTVAALSAEFYDGIRERELGSRINARASSGRVPKATEEAVRAFADKLVKGDPVAFENLVLSRIDYEVKVASAMATLNAGKYDPVPPKFARVPTGDETCAFCLMLASRGFVYRNLEAASHAHANCDCRVVPAWNVKDPRDPTLVEGYDPREIYDRWDAIVHGEDEE